MKDFIKSEKAIMIIEFERAVSSKSTPLTFSASEWM